MFPKISLKLDTMRKPQTFVIIRHSDGNIFLQSDKRAILLSPAKEGKNAVLSTKGNSSIDLHPLRSPKLIQMDEDTIREIQDKLAPVDPNGRTSLGGGVVQVANTVQVIG